MTKLQRCIALLAALILGCAIIAVGIASAFVPKRKFHGRIVDILPMGEQVGGWQISLQNVADSLELRRFEKEILEYDDATYVDYSRGNTRISVYLAYWAPGRTSSSWVASHTPDLCWVQQGWVCFSRENKTMGMSAASLPMEQRTFGLHGQVEHVLFCHIVDGRIATYAGFGPKPARGRDFLEQIIAGRWVRPDAEQFFLRISSNRPIAEIQDSAPVALLVSEVRAAASGQVAKKRDI